MTAVRAWRRQLYGGLGVALIVPATLVAALGVLAFAGGFAGLGALRQAVSGPPVPAGLGPAGGHPSAASSRSRAARPALAGQADRVLVAGAVTRTRRGVGRSAPRTHAVAPGNWVGGTRPVTPGAPKHNGGGAGSPGGGSGAPGSGGGSPGGGGSGAPGSPPSSPTLTDGVVSAATSVTGQAPAPVGPAATQVLKSVGAVVDAVAPLPPPGQPSPSASPGAPAAVLLP